MRAVGAVFSFLFGVAGFLSLYYLLNIVFDLLVDNLTVYPEFIVAWSLISFLFSAIVGVVIIAWGLSHVSEETHTYWRQR